MFRYNNIIIVGSISLTQEIMAAPFGQNTVLSDLCVEWLYSI